MSAFICDLNGRIVKTFFDREKGNPGTHEVTWDGRDDNGQLCPTGAYIPIIKVRSRQQGSEIYNPSETPWGLTLNGHDISYNAQTKQVSYRLDQPALCQMRIGEKEGGPAYISLFGWVPRSQGDYHAAWDGKDVNGLIEVWKKEHFEIYLDAFSLPENSILLNGSNPRSYNYKGLKKRFPIKPPVGSTINLHALHQREFCHDMLLNAAFKSGKKTADGIPIIEGQAELQVFAGKDVNLRQLEREKFELYIFVDGKMLIESPHPSLPASQTIDTTTISNGDRIFTINLRTFEDHLGIFSFKVRVDN
ncbi:hypothetical protein DSCA_25380 [Desulfosarcina alkanivorans]|uniref:FlgD Ig-like domain-containing protein n=2 Tax=Desulfosarcina alkanivorans TaxID=571177 RepID=A0A5K7YI38_9BACT|nr:hypothetical protein DSCA_25380 [Desulfosarcina alkanivorans]